MPFGDPRDRGLEANAHTSVAADIGKSAHSGLVEGLSQLAGSLGDAHAFADAMGQKVAQFVGAKPGQPVFQAPLPVRAVGAAVHGIAQQAHVDPAKLALLTALTGPAALGSAPTSAQVQQGVTHGQPLYEPQTKAGRYARTIAQFAPAAAAPGGVARRLASVIAPGALSEAAGEITHDKAPQLEPYARVAGALVGGGAASLVGGAGPRTRILAEATRGASDAQIAQARQLMETGQREGVQLTMAEALQQVTGGATGMGRVQRVIEGTKAGAERINPVMAQRPGQVRGALLNFADTVAPPTDQPSMVGTGAQAAADGGLNQVRQFVNFGAQPHYDALVGQALPAAEFAGLRQNPTFAAALGELRSNPELNAPIAHLPDNDLSVINEVQKRIQGMAETARPSPTNPGGNNQLAALRGGAAGQVEQVASNASPDWRAARDAVSAGRQEYLEPLQRGPLGEIADTTDTGRQVRALFPNQPMEGQADEVGRAVQMLNSVDPQAAPSLVRQFLAGSANEATQQLQSGPNAWGGAKWAATRAGNPEQEATMMAAVGGAGGDTGRLANIIDVLRATGKRQAPGSMTAYNARDLEELGKAGVVGEIARTGLNPPGVFRRIGEGFQDWQTERNAGRLADAILSAPEQAQQILLHARGVVPPGQALDNITRLALAAQQSRQPEQLPGPSSGP